MLICLFAHTISKLSGTIHKSIIMNAPVAMTISSAKKIEVVELVLSGRYNDLVHTREVMLLFVHLPRTCRQGCYNNRMALYSGTSNSQSFWIVSMAKIFINDTKWMCCPLVDLNPQLLLSEGLNLNLLI